jgi:hypothetical protein
MENPDRRFMAFSQILWPGEIGYVQAFFDGTPASGRGFLVYTICENAVA